MKSADSKTNFVIKLLSVALLLTFYTPTAKANYTAKPRVGDCFLHTNAEMSAEFASKNPISCSKRHNVEIYKVGTWPSETPPWQMPDDQAVDVAASVCATNSSFNRLNPKSFNYWAWFTPNKSQWAKGLRWLRCDGMYIVSALDENDSSTWVFRAWTGKRI